MRDFSLVYLLAFLAATLVAAAFAFLAWVAIRKRIAGQTVGRAGEHAQRIVRDAEREAEAKHKEVLLAAIEKAHELLLQTDHQVRDRRQEISALEQQLTKKSQAIAERESAAQQVDTELRGRERSVTEREQTAATAISRYEQLIAEHQRELQRVAGLTADEAQRYPASADRNRRQTGRRQPGEAARGRGARGGERQGQADHHAGDPAQRGGARD